MKDSRKAAYAFLVLLGVISLFSDLWAMGALYDRSRVGLVIFSVLAQLASLPFFFAARGALARNVKAVN